MYSDIINILTFVFIFCFIICILIILYKYLIRKHCDKNFNKYIVNNKYNTEKEYINGIKIIVYKSEMCPACKNFKPIWKSLISEFEKRDIIYEEIDCDKNKCVNVKYIPKIVIIKYNKQIHYSGDRDKKSILSFLDSIR